jgi:hypothetical protein
MAADHATNAAMFKAVWGVDVAKHTVAAALARRTPLSRSHRDRSNAFGA